MVKNKRLLFELDILVKFLRATPYKETKIAYLKKHKEACKDVLGKVIDKRYKFNITGDAVIDFMNSEKFEYFDSPGLLDHILFAVHHKQLTGDKAKNTVASFFAKYPKYIPLLTDIFNKNLKAGVSEKLFEKAFGVTISFDVPRAEIYDEKRIDFEHNNYMISRKRNGVRCLVHFDYTKNKNNPEINFLSKYGRPLKTLKNLIPDLRLFEQNFHYDGLHKNANEKSNYYLDGEVCIFDETGNESFKLISQEINRKNHSIDTPKYFIFDVYTEKEFNEKKSIIGFAYKYNCLSSTVINLPNQLRNIDYMYNARVEDLFELQEAIEELPDHYEGLVIRNELPTVFKKSFNLMKIKKFKDAEFTVIDVEYGYMPIQTDTGETEQIYCAMNLIIDYKGRRAKVGSRISNEQRLLWLKKEKIVGHKITVKYFDESIDKHGNVNLLWASLLKDHGFERTE